MRAWHGLLLAVLLGAAGPAPDWAGADGHAAIEATPHGGVAVVLPADAIPDGTDPTVVVTAFLNRFGPGVCTDILGEIDGTGKGFFQRPHKALRVGLRIQTTAWRTDTAAFHVVDPHTGYVVIDYQPDREVRCIEAGPPTS